jgi:hypothetical protein
MGWPMRLSTYAQTPWFDKLTMRGLGRQPAPKAKQARLTPRLNESPVDRDQTSSKRSAFITFVQAATKSLANFSFASELP